MIHVVIPAAGAGSRFVAAGYGPKIHADVHGTPMLRAVVDNIRPAVEHCVTVVVTGEPPALGEGVELVRLRKATRGAVETVLAADIGPGPLLVANCDQLVHFPTHRLADSPADVVLAVFDSRQPHHSYVRCASATGGVIEIVEKPEHPKGFAVAGVYYFADGLAFVSAARAVLDQDRRVLGEFYLSTVIAEMIGRGAVVRAFLGGRVDILGTPEELDAYLGRVPA